MTFIPGEQGTKVNFLVEQGTMAILGNMEHKKTIFDSSGNRNTNLFISGEPGNGYTPRRVS